MTSTKILNIFLVPSLALCLALTVGCSSSKKTTDGKQADTAMKSQSKEWTLYMGGGGGISGRYSGYAIKSNRTAYSWQGSQDTAKTTVTLDADVIDYIHAQLDALKFRSYNINNPYNMTYLLELREGDSVYRLHWGDPNAPPPEQIASFYAALTSFMRERVGR